MSDDDAIFESEVRRVASVRWPTVEPVVPENFFGRERDAVIVTDDLIHIIEGTTSRKKSKAEDDIKKSIDLTKSLRAQYSDKVFRIWFITASDPTSDQVEVVRKAQTKFSYGKITACSFRNFCSGIVDGARYLELRSHVAFGSIRNPEVDSDFEVPEDEYVPIDLINSETGEQFSLSNIDDLFFATESIKDRQALLILGDYGAGKSMTLRHVFAKRRSEYLKGSAQKFSIFLNLRDHFGQDNPSEALFRHCTSIGFENPNTLTAAWRAGFIDVFLDGFDELSSLRIVRGTLGLRKARYGAVGLVRNFIQQTPSRSKIVISGRGNYFDTTDELRRSLGISQNTIILNTSEFTEPQIQSYLAKKNVDAFVPEWLPARPLLVGYLAVKGFLEKDTNNGGIASLQSMTQEEGWDFLLRKIYEREARQIDEHFIEPEGVREFVERIASKTRSSISGLGPIHTRDIDDIFEYTFGVRPNEKAEAFILRLPGFTSGSDSADEREFVDTDFADACKAGEMVRYIADPYNFKSEYIHDANCELGELGARMLAHKSQYLSAKQISAFLDYASEKIENPYIAYDALRCLIFRGDQFTGKKLQFRDCIFHEMEVSSDYYIGPVEFSGCYFGGMEANISKTSNSGIIFDECIVASLSGPVSEDEFRRAFTFNGGSIEKLVDEIETNADIMEAELALGVKVLLTILRKIFVQKGRGRKESALYRGLDQRAKSKVNDILSLVESYGFARPHRRSGPTIWIPDRSMAKYAAAILSNPNASRHRIISDSKSI